MFQNFTVERKTGTNRKFILNTQCFTWTFVTVWS